MHTCIQAYIHTYIHTYTHTYIHTNVHTYIHTYTHTYIIEDYYRVVGLWNNMIVLLDTITIFKREVEAWPIRRLWFNCSVYTIAQNTGLLHNLRSYNCYVISSEISVLF